MKSITSRKSPVLDCRVAVLTPPGRGAVATVAVWGEDAVDVVARLFHPVGGGPLTRFGLGRIVLGNWEHSADTAFGEQLVVCCRDADRVEVHCHGGHAAVQRIMESFVAEGCSRLKTQAWTRQREADRLVADARLALADASTERTAAILLDQYRGALSRIVDKIVERLIAGQVESATELLRSLRDRAGFGLHLLQPWRIVLAGRPNTGKSSLINAILGYQRAIVHHQAGTTRDVLTAMTAVDGWPVMLVDTAGLGECEQDSIEANGMARANEQLEQADATLLVTDLTQPWPDELFRPMASMGDKVMVVHNKLDLVHQPPDDRPPGLFTSALTGQGIGPLLDSIAKRLVPVPPAPGEAVPFLPRHEHALTQAINALQVGDAALARRVLAAMLGSNQD